MPGLIPQSCTAAMVQGIRYDETLVIGQGHDYYLKWVSSILWWFWGNVYIPIASITIPLPKEHIQSKGLSGNCRRRPVNAGGWTWVYYPAAGGNSGNGYSNSERIMRLFRISRKACWPADRGCGWKASEPPSHVHLCILWMLRIIRLCSDHTQGIVRYYKEYLSRKRIHKPLKSEIKAA